MINFLPTKLFVRPKSNISSIHSSSMINKGQLRPFTTLKSLQ